MIIDRSFMSYGTYKKLTIASFVVWLFINLLCLLGCNSNRSIGAVNSPNKEFLVTKKNVTNRLQETAIDYHVIDCGVYGSFIVMEKGARILGPFSKDTGESFSWLNQAWKDSKSFTELVNDNAWNYGGCRIWLGPELEYNIQDVNILWDSYIVPSEIDPGYFQIVQKDETSVLLCSEFTIKAYKSNDYPKANISKYIQKADNPLRYASLDKKHLTSIPFVGYEESIRLELVEAKNSVLMDVWNLLQVNPGGQVIVPCTPGLRVTNYLEPLNSDYMKITPQMASFRIDGQNGYKVGIGASGIFNRVGYLCKHSEGTMSLIVRNFLNIPSSQYADISPNQTDQNGDILQIYNDFGDLGGYGEIECHSPAIGPQGVADVVMYIQTWTYWGPEENILDIATTLLGQAAYNF